MDSSSAFELAATDAIGQAALAASGEVSAVELLGLRSSGSRRRAP